MPLHGERLRAPLPKPQSRAALKKQSERDKEREWQQVRKVVLVRDHYRCRYCGTADHVDVHHIRFRSRGGADVPENLAALCRCCHREIHGYRLHISGDANGSLRFERTR